MSYIPKPSKIAQIITILKEIRDSGTSGGTSGETSVGDVDIFMTVQVLNELLLNAVTKTGASTPAYVLDKKRLTVCVIASGITSGGGTFTFQASPAGANWGTVSSVGISGTVGSTQEISANGVYFFDIVNASSVAYFRANLTARTDGTFTVYLMGGAL